MSGATRPLAGRISICDDNHGVAQWHCMQFSIAAASILTIIRIFAKKNCGIHAAGFDDRLCLQ
jgi:hypothetical protein